MKLELHVEVPKSLEAIFREQLGSELDDSAKTALAITWYRAGKLAIEVVAEFLEIPLAEAKSRVAEWTTIAFSEDKQKLEGDRDSNISSNGDSYIENREKRLAHFDAWMSRQRSRNPNFDDSRESIYPDR